MNKKTEDHSTTPASVSDSMTEIATLLMGGNEDQDSDDIATPEENPDESTANAGDEEGAETLPDESNEDAEGEQDDGDPDSTEETEDPEEQDESLAKMLGLDDDQVTITDNGEFLLNVKVDGEHGQVKLTEVLKSYQTEGSVTNRSKALAKDRKEFDDAVQVKATEIKKSLEQNYQLTQVLEQEILADYNAVNWDELRQYEPAEWSAKRQEFNDKYHKIKTLQDGIKQEATKEQEEAIKAAKKQEAAYLKGQWDLMISNNPTWTNKAVYSKDMDGLRDFTMQTYGFSDKDLGSVGDARIIELVKDAQAYRKGLQVAKKKVIKIPKIQKRKGSRKAPKVSKLDKLTAAAKKATGARKRTLQNDAVAQLLLGEP